MPSRREDPLVQTLPDPPPPADECLVEEWQVLVAALGSCDLARRLAAARHLQQVGAPAVPLLVTVLTEGTIEFRESVLATLGLIGPTARSALPQLAPLCEDERLGPAAQRAVRLIRRGWTLDWKTISKASLPWLMALLVLATVVHEVASWLGLFAQMEGLAFQIALVWAFLGALAGAVFGANCGSGWLARKGAEYLAVAGACAGAVAGRWVGTIIEPLVQVLAR